MQTGVLTKIWVVALLLLGVVSLSLGGASAEPQAQDEQSALILACHNGGLCGPRISKYVGGNTYNYVLQPKNGAAVCGAIKANAAGVNGVNDALKLIKNSGFSDMEATAILIKIVNLDCKPSETDLFNWAITPGHTA